MGDFNIDINLIKPGGIISARSKFKLFLNGLWYEPETLWLVLTFTTDYFVEKKRVTYFFTRVIIKNRSLDM